MSFHIFNIIMFIFLPFIKNILTAITTPTCLFVCHHHCFLPNLEEGHPCLLPNLEEGHQCLLPNLEEGCTGLLPDLRPGRRSHHPSSRSGRRQRRPWTFFQIWKLVATPSSRKKATMPSSRKKAMKRMWYGEWLTVSGEAAVDSEQPTNIKEDF